MDILEIQQRVDYVKIERDEQGQCTNQDEVHAFMRKGLKSFLPRLTTAEKAVEQSSIPLDMLDALMVIENRCCPGEWLAAMEVYDNGFNVFGLRAGEPESFGVWSYRR